MHPPSDRDLAIERALRLAAHELERAAGGGWRLTVANGTRTTLHARVSDEDWLVVTAPCASSAPSWWPLLRLNAGLAGCARLVRAASGDLEVRAEIFVGCAAHDVDGAEGHDTSLGLRVVALCEDIASAGHEVLDPLPDDVAETTPGSPADPDRLVSLCGEAGWSATARAAGDVQVSLDTRTIPFQATLALAEDLRLRVVAPLTTSAVASDGSQDAIALLLLDAGVHLRTVKGVAVRQGDVELAGLAFAGERLAASPATIDRALAALSVACSTVGREVQALQDAQLARDYLALRHPHGTDSRSSLPYSREQEDTPCLQLP